MTEIPAPPPRLNHEDPAQHRLGNPGYRGLLQDNLTIFGMYFVTPKNQKLIHSHV